MPQSANCQHGNTFIMLSEVCNSVTYRELFDNERNFDVLKVMYVSLIENMQCTNYCKERYTVKTLKITFAL